MRELRLDADAERTLQELVASPRHAGLVKQLRKTLTYLCADVRHPSLQTHKLKKVVSPQGDPVFEAYVQQHTPSAYRIFFFYGPDELRNKKRIPVITIVAILPHP